MPTAILSVYDKTGIVEFAQGLASLGWTLLASGGTAKLLHENGLTVTEVADYTGSPEILGGRVKTLHPAIHGGLLARPTDEDHQQLLDLGWDYIDLVAVNLYPFEATIAKPEVTYAEVIEQIDIGGVALIRAAAKNHERVTLVCDPADYASVLEAIQNGKVPLRCANPWRSKASRLRCITTPLFPVILVVERLLCKTLLISKINIRQAHTPNKTWSSCADRVPASSMQTATNTWIARPGTAWRI